MNLRDFLRELRIPFREHGQHHHVSHNWVGIDCPDCSPRSNRFRLGINPRTLKCSCYVCGRRWLPEVLAAAADVPLRSVLAALPGFATVRPERDDRPRGRYSPPEGAGPMSRVHREYLARRGIDPDAAAAVWNVGGIGLASRLRWRLFLPCPDAEGNPVSWTTRAVGDRVGLRYLSASPECEARPLKECLYGEHLARSSVVVVEGPMDALAVGPGAVATLGLTVTRPQIRRLSRFAAVAICFDGEPAAQRQAGKLADTLASCGTAVFRVCLDAKDPGSASRSEIEELRKRFLQ